MTNLKLSPNQKEILMDIIQLDQESLHVYMRELLLTFYPQDSFYESKGNGMYFKGDAPVLLVAHLDTVHARQPREEEIFHDVEKGVIWSPVGIGADCRAGVFNIVATVARGYRPHIMLTWEEERGGVGASNLMKLWGKNSMTPEAVEVTEAMKNVNFAVQYDRRGIDEAVYYYLDNKEFEDYISDFGYNTKIGSYTDICEICPEFGFAGVNVAAGYVDEHTKQELLLVDEMLKTQDRVIKMIEDQMENPVFFEYTEMNYNYNSWKGSSYYYDEEYSGSPSGRKDVAYSESWYSYEEVEDLDFGEEPTIESCYSCGEDLIKDNNWSPSVDQFQDISCYSCRILYAEESADVPSEMIQNLK